MIPTCGFWLTHGTFWAKAIWDVDLPCKRSDETGFEGGDIDQIGVFVNCTRKKERTCWHHQSLNSLLADLIPSSLSTKKNFEQHNHAHSPETNILNPWNKHRWSHICTVSISDVVTTLIDSEQVVPVIQVNHDKSISKKPNTLSNISEWPSEICGGKKISL